MTYYLVNKCQLRIKMSFCENNYDKCYDVIKNENNGRYMGTTHMSKTVVATKTNENEVLMK